MATYQDLINRGGEITNQSTGRVYPNPQELATDLGIAPHQIDWSQITAAGGQGNVGTTTASPITSFNTALMGKLKEYQGLSSADLIKRQSAILKKMYQKQAQITPEEQRVLSPSQQATVRGGQVSALAPELEATKGQLLDRQEAQKRFLETIGIAQDMSKQLEDVRAQQEEKAMEGLKLLAYSDSPISQAQISQVASLTGYNPTALTGYVQELQRQAKGQKTLDDLELALKKKELAKPYYKPSVSTDDESITAAQARDIKYLVTAPNWFRKRIEKTFDAQFQTPTEATIQKEWQAMKETEEVDKEETIWAWLATPEAQALSSQEKKDQIMSYGLNPNDFNIY